MNLIKKSAACSLPPCNMSPEKADEVSNVVIQPLNVLSCALLFAGPTFAGYISHK